MASFTASDISKLIECRKKRAELLFKKGYLIWKNSENEKLRKEIDSEFIAAESELENIQGKLGKFSPVLPDQEKLEELNKEITSFEQEELYEAMKEKEGKAYKVLKERGDLFKYIFEKKEEIAKLNMIIHNLNSKEKSSIINILRNKSDFSEEPIEKIKDKKTRTDLFKLFSRINYPVSEPHLKVKEEKVLLRSTVLWVPSSVVPKVNTINQSIEELSRKLQFMNAQKQIKDFSDAEEKEFVSMQDQYLSLLKEQDRLINNFAMD